MVTSDMTKKDLPENHQLMLDAYEIHILWRAVRQYIALQDVELAEVDDNPNNPEMHSIEEMKARAIMLRNRVDTLFHKI